MRTLTTTQLAMQQGLAVSPAVRCTRLRASGGELRYPQNLISVTGLTASDPTAVCAGAGTTSIFTLTGSGDVKQTRLAGSPLVQGATTVAFTTTDGIIAAAQYSATIAVVTVDRSNCTIDVWLCTNGGTSWAAAESYVLTFTGNPVANLQNVAAAWDSAGSKLFIVLDDDSRLWLITRTAPNTYTTATRNSESFAGGVSYVKGLGCCYTKAPGGGTGDVLILHTGSYVATYSELALVLFGDGDQLTAGVWQTHKDLLSVQGGAGAVYGTTLTAGGLALADTVHATFLEDFHNNLPSAGSPPQTDVSVQRGWFTTILTPANAKAATARDPQPLPLAQTRVLFPAYDPSTSTLVYANASAAYWGAAPTLQDLSSRVLTAVRTDVENQATARVVLDNADGALTALAYDPDVCGDRVSLDFGYVTAGGTEVSAAAPLWLSALELTSGFAGTASGRAFCELTLHDAWHLLAAWSPRRLYVWSAGQSSVQSLIQWVLARSGIGFTAPGSPSAQLQLLPAFSIHPASSGAHALHALLDMVPEVLRFDTAGGVLVLPLANDSPVYSYSPSSHPVLAARVTMATQALNHVLLFGKGNPQETGPTLIAEAIDQPDAQRISGHPFPVTDMQVSISSAPGRAAVPLRKAQLLADTGEIASVPNVGLELWDPIAITESTAGLSSTLRRVRAIHTEYNALPEGGVFTQSVGLMNP